MRIRSTPIKRLLAAALVVTGLSVAAAPPAFADPGKATGKELVDCVEKALHNNAATNAKQDYKPFQNALDDCRKATSLLTPAVSEMIWGIIAFAVVAFALMKFAFPSIKKVLKTREDKIRGDIEGAEHSRAEAEQLVEQHRAELAGARGEADRIIEEARVAAEAVRQERITAAEAEAAEIRAPRGRGHPPGDPASLERSLRPRGRALDRAGREGGRAQPRSRHADRAHRELHQPGGEQLAVPASTRVEAYANALLEVSRVEGHLAEVEDELFRFARTFEGSDELRSALTDPTLPTERRVAVIEDLLGPKALQTSSALASFLVAAGRASDLPAIVNRFVELAVAEQRRAVAEVRSAIELTPEQTERLREALNRATGKDVEVKVVIDPSVLGGLVARVGDIVIDGSVRHRLEQLREQI